MAGKKPPSPKTPDGVKASRARKPRDEGPRKLPSLGDTPESVQHYTASLARSIECGAFPTKTAKALTDAANTHLRAVNARLRREEMERLEAMLREAKELRKDGLGYEESCRKHKSEPLLGKWVSVDLPDGSKAWAHASK